MKLTALAAVMAGASYLQVSATPISLLLATSSISTTTDTNPAANNNNPAFEHLRLGHPNQAAWLQDPHAPGPSGGTWAVEHHCPCGGGRNRFHDHVKAKTLEITSFFRAAFGWPLKEPAFHHGKHHHKHGKHQDDHDHQRHGKHQHDKGPEGKHGGPLFIEAAPPCVAVLPRFGQLGTTFGMRFDRSLMEFGLWEGRVMVIVYGCGIGVLVWMFCAVAIVIIGKVRGNRTSQYALVAVSAEDAMVPLPNYVFGDVKIPIAVDDVKAPVVVEEIKKTTEDESK